MSLKTRGREEERRWSARESRARQDRKEAIRNVLHSKSESLDRLGRNVVNHRAEL